MGDRGGEGLFICMQGYTYIAMRAWCRNAAACSMRARADQRACAVGLQYGAREHVCVRRIEYGVRERVCVYVCACVCARERVCVRVCVVAVRAPQTPQRCGAGY